MGASEQASGDENDVANIHLQIGGEDRCVRVAIPRGNNPVGAVLPAARQISHEVTSLAVAAAQREGRSVSCRAGCGACCRQLVVVSFAEAQSLAEVVAAMPPERQRVVRQRFADALKRLEDARLLDHSEPPGQRHFIHVQRDPGKPEIPPSQRYFQLQIPCPFLEDESCGIYEDRPLVCREYLVTNPPERCARLFQDDVEIDGIQAAVRIAPVLVRVTNKVAGTPEESIPLVLALEWAEHHPAALNNQVDGLDLLRHLVTETQIEQRRAAQA